jgi:hypothetical protein
VAGDDLGGEGVAGWVVSHPVGQGCRGLEASNSGMVEKAPKRRLSVKLC